MASLLSDIEKKVRALIGGDPVVLTLGPGLEMVNMIYREMVSSAKWPEFRETYTVVAATTSGTEQYTWASAAPDFNGPVEIEVGSDASDSNFVLLLSPGSDEEWNNALLMKDFIPKYYRRYHDGTDEKIEVRPAPNYSSASIRATGQIEPTALTVPGSSTEFIQTTADDALSKLIASNMLLRTQPELAIKYQTDALSTIRSLVGLPIAPENLQVK